MAKWVRKYPTICYLQDTHYRCKEPYILKVKEWENISQGNGNQKKARTAVFISDRRDIKPRTVIQNKDGRK